MSVSWFNTGCCAPPRWNTQCISYSFTHTNKERLSGAAQRHANTPVLWKTEELNANCQTRSRKWQAKCVCVGVDVCVRTKKKRENGVNCGALKFLRQDLKFETSFCELMPRKQAWNIHFFEYCCKTCSTHLKMQEAANPQRDSVVGVMFKNMPPTSFANIYFRTHVFLFCTENIQRKNKSHFNIYC